MTEDLIEPTDVDAQSTSSDIRRIIYNKEDREAIIKDALEFKKVLSEDKGYYIISCLEDVCNSRTNIFGFKEFIKYLNYAYSRNLAHFLSYILLSSPPLVYEAKEIIADREINAFLDDIVIRYGSKLKRLYAISRGPTDWNAIRSAPLLRDDCLALNNDINMANGEILSFTSPMYSTPLLVYHFLKHISKCNNLFKERSLEALDIQLLNKISEQLKEILDQIESFEKSKLPDEENKENKSKNDSETSDE